MKHFPHFAHFPLPPLRGDGAEKQTTIVSIGRGQRLPSAATSPV